MPKCCVGVKMDILEEILLLFLVCVLHDCYLSLTTSLIYIISLNFRNICLTFHKSEKVYLYNTVYYLL